MMGFGLLLTVFVVGAIVYALGWRPDSPSGQPVPWNSKSPLDIARERYARGEIDKAEFEQLRQSLES